MRKAVCVLTFAAALAAAPAASAEPQPGCKAFGQGVAFNKAPEFRQAVSTLARAGGNPLLTSRFALCP